MATSVNFISEKDGAMLERTCGFVCKKWSKRDSDVVDTTGTSKDKLEGTDSEIYGVRCYFTLNPEKNNTEWVEDISISIPFADFANADVKIGIRTGNGVVKFNVPVLVLFVKGNPYLLSKYNEEFANSLLEKFDEVVDKGMEAYWDFIDAHPEYEACFA